MYVDSHQEQALENQLKWIQLRSTLTVPRLYRPVLFVQ